VNGKMVMQITTLVVCCWLFVVGCLLAVGCLLPVVCCLLFVAGCLLLVVCF